MRFKESDVLLYYIGTMQPDCLPAVEFLGEHGFEIRSFADLATACAAMQTAEHRPEVVILDESGGRDAVETMRSAVMAILSINAFVYISAMTNRDAAEYHDAMEGLGMLSPLPCPAAREDGERLLTELRSFLPIA